MIQIADSVVQRVRAPISSFYLQLQTSLHRINEYLKANASSINVTDSLSFIRNNQIPLKSANLDSITFSFLQIQDKIDTILNLNIQVLIYGLVLIIISVFLIIPPFRIYYNKVITWRALLACKSECGK